jgi:hypothetical protein
MQKPDIDTVQSYCAERRNGIDPVAFVDYYDSVGWMIGKKPMKDWQAAVRTWERRTKQDQSAKRPQLMDQLQDRSWAN